MGPGGHRPRSGRSRGRALDRVAGCADRRHRETDRRRRRTAAGFARTLRFRRPAAAAHPHLRCAAGARERRGAAFHLQPSRRPGPDRPRHGAARAGAGRAGRRRHQCRRARALAGPRRQAGSRAARRALGRHQAGRDQVLAHRVLAPPPWARSRSSMARSCCAGTAATGRSSWPTRSTPVWNGPAPTRPCPWSAIACCRRWAKIGRRRVSRSGRRSRTGWRAARKARSPCASTTTRSRSISTARWRCRHVRISMARSPARRPRCASRRSGSASPCLCPAPIATLRSRAKPSSIPALLSFPNLSLSIDGNALDGAASIRLDGPRPQISATLAGASVNLAPLLEEIPAPAPGGQWSHEIFPAARLAAADLDLRLSASHARLGDFQADDAALSAILKNGRLDLSLAEASAYSGQVRARAIIAENGAGLDIRGSASAEKLDVAAALWDGFKRQTLTGVGRGSISFETSGDSFAELASHLDARGDVTRGKRRNLWHGPRPRLPPDGAPAIDRRPRNALGAHRI